MKTYNVRIIFDNSLIYYEEVKAQSKKEAYAKAKTNWPQNYSDPQN